MLLLSLLLAAAPAAADTAVGAPAARQEGPAVFVHAQPAHPVVALRLSLLADDPPGFAGAGHLLQHLHLPALEEQAARVGGRVQVVRTSDAVVYTVVGPARELDYLAGILRGALRAPRAGAGERLQALRTLRDERDAERETAPAYVRAALRQQLWPDDLPAAGTDAAGRRLEAASLDDVWGRMYAPGRVAVVAVGDVRLDDVERAFRTVPPGDAGGWWDEARADTLPALAADTPQATRAWIGQAYRADTAVSPAALSVAARLLRDRLRRGLPAGAQVEAEHWWTHRGHGVALVVAVSGPQSTAARRTVQGALAALAQGLGEAPVRAAAEQVRRDMLFYSRTPERLAEVLGGFVDRGEPSAAAQDFYDALGEVTAADVRAAVAALRAGTAAGLLVPPQAVVPAR